MPGPSSLGGRKSGSSQAAQLPEGSPCSAAHRHWVARAPQPQCPRGRSALPKAWQRRSPRGGWQGYQLNYFCKSGKETKKRRRKRKIYQQESANRGERGANGKQAKLAHQKAKDLLAEN